MTPREPDYDEIEDEEDDDGLEDANGYSRADLLFGGNW